MRWSYASLTPAVEERYAQKDNRNLTDDRIGRTGHTFMEIAKAATPKTIGVQGYPQNVKRARQLGFGAA